MSTLWGSRKSGDDRNDDNAGESSHEGGRREPEHEPTERDRLLPQDQHRRPPNRDGYLDPDDPAVSPYNLWTVRFVRYFTIVFMMITFVWWVLLLVSIFISPPGLHTRGSGFFDFSYTSLTLGLLLCSLLFFSAPSLAMQICQGVIAALMLINLITIVSVDRLRYEEGPPGIASVVWITLMGIWCVFTDRLVAWGKREEEERLTGRAENRRTVKQWFSVLVATIILVVYILIAILMTATLFLRAKDAGLEMQGQRIFVDNDKYEVHLACVGNVTYDDAGRAAPTILLEASEEPVELGFEPWANAAYKNGTISRYCYWDRPGYAWSDNSPSPHSAGMSAENLAEALAVLGEQGPWILVSSGYGSLVSRIFSARNLQSVAGIMLVDALHEGLLYRIGNAGRGFILWGYGIISPLGLERLAGALFKGRTSEDRVYGRSAYQGGKFIKAQLQENLVAQSLTKTEVAAARTIESVKTPLVVISSGIEVRKDKEWERSQKDLTKITDRLIDWTVVNKAPHSVWRTYEGRKVMEDRVGELVRIYLERDDDEEPPFA